MTIQETVQNDLTTAIKNRDSIKEDLKVIISEFQRQKTKVISDDIAIQALRWLAKKEKERLSSIGHTDSDYLNLINKYIPIQEDVAENDEIETWINKNIDLTKLKNKYSAIRTILAHFGTRSSGSQIRNVLDNMEI